MTHLDPSLFLNPVLLESIRNKYDFEIDYTRLLELGFDFYTSPRFPGVSMAVPQTEPLIEIQVHYDGLIEVFHSTPDLDEYLDNLEILKGVDNL